MRFLLPILLAASFASAEPRTVHFQSEDHQTELVAYLFEPATPGAHPAIVLLHGRAGAYSSLANGVYTAATLSKRHKAWGQFWAERNYAALLVDSFGPRGYPAGFPKGSYQDRPAAVSEQTIRPLDAYAALLFLQRRPGVLKDRIGVQGWSNGGMTVLAAMSDQSPGLPAAGPKFRAALAEYPGCGMDAIKGEYRNYAPVLMLLAGSDQEVNPKTCDAFAAKAIAHGNHLVVHIFPGAEHNYDDPSQSKQSNAADHAATEDTYRRAEAFFAETLRP